jgi:hypothetical protein
MMGILCEGGSNVTKKVKSISLNDKNAEEKEIIKHLGKRNFSKYVKGLIREDMKRRAAEKGGGVQRERELDNAITAKPLTAKERLAQMKNRSEKQLTPKKSED